MAGVSAPPYTLKLVQETLGLSRTVVSGLIDAGFVAPQRGPRNEHRFSFQDVMLLRTAYALEQARISPRKILRVMAKLRASLPEELPLTGLRITAVGDKVVVRDGLTNWDADSGQALMDFEVATVAGQVSFLPRLTPGPSVNDAGSDQTVSGRTANPEAWFQRGEELEATDPDAAEAAYRKALKLSPAYVHAYLNLGAMLCEASRCHEAVDLYEEALAHGAADPLLHFNHAIALEDQGRPREALESYRLALQLDSEFADAHFNAGRLLERMGDARGALRHFSAYRRAQKLAEQV